jgi:hypothetical protein
MSKVILSISLEHLECPECPTLALHMHDCFEAGMIVNEDNTISVTLMYEGPYRTKVNNMGPDMEKCQDP